MTAEPSNPRRVRLRLLVLLWVWAFLVFLVVDLFLAVSAFDSIRPRSSLYRGMQSAAHEMVGRDYEPGTPPVRRTRVDPVRAQIDKALMDRDWKRAWRLIRESGRAFKSSPRLRQDLLAALRVSLQRLEERVSDSDELRALKGLLIRIGDDRVLIGLVEVLGDLEDTRAIIVSSDILQNVLNANWPKRGGDAFDVVGTRLERVLIVARERADPEKAMRVAHLLATLSTPRATAAILRNVDANDRHAVALRSIRDPASVRLLGDALLSSRYHPFATHLSYGMANCGPRGKQELCQVVSAPRHEWRELGPARGAAIVALAASVSDASHLTSIESALEQVPELLETISSILEFTPGDPKRLSAMAEYISRYPRSKLDGALLAALAKYPEEKLNPHLTDTQLARVARVRKKQRPAVRVGSRRR